MKGKTENDLIKMPFNAAFKLFNWYPMLTLPLFIYMGYILSESGIADDLYAMFHVWFGGLKGGLAVGTIMLMVVISAMNGLSVAGMAIGATIAPVNTSAGAPSGYGLSNAVSGSKNSLSTPWIR